MGEGFKYFMGGIELGRVNIAARGVGIATRAFEEAIRYAQQREAFGKPIAQHQAIQLKLAQMATKIEAARLLTMQAAERKDAGERADLEAGMAKLLRDRDRARRSRSRRCASTAATATRRSSSSSGSTATRPC